VVLKSLIAVIAILAGAFGLDFTARAGEADVVGVEIQKQGNGSYRFDVTVRHADEGWDHYADKWVVTDTDGTVLGERVLVHPHVNEQPFTRSLSSVTIPNGTDTVIIKAHDSVHNWGGKVIEVAVPR